MAAQARHQHDAERQDEQTVYVSEHWDEVGDQVDRAQHVSPRKTAASFAARHARIAGSKIGRVNVSPDRAVQDLSRCQRRFRSSNPGRTPTAVRTLDVGTAGGAQRGRTLNRVLLASIPGPGSAA
jgi:hypothetical protein